MSSWVTSSISTFVVASEEATEEGRFAGILSFFQTRTGDPSLPSSDEAGTVGTGRKPRARKPRKKKETAEDE
jgi:hypothetical protein